VADDGVSTGGASNVIQNAAAAVGSVGVEGAGDIEDEAAPAVAVVVIRVSADGVDIESVGAFAGGEGAGGDDEAGGIVTCDAVGVGVERAGGVGEAGALLWLLLLLLSKTLVVLLMLLSLLVAALVSRVPNVLLQLLVVLLMMASALSRVQVVSVMLVSLLKRREVSTLKSGQLVEGAQAAETMAAMAREAVGMVLAGSLSGPQ